MRKKAGRQNNRVGHLKRWQSIPTTPLSPYSLLFIHKLILLKCMCRYFITIKKSVVSQNIQPQIVDVEPIKYSRSNILRLAENLLRLQLNFAVNYTIIYISL